MSTVSTSSGATQLSGTPASWRLYSFAISSVQVLLVIIVGSVGVVASLISVLLPKSRATPIQTTGRRDSSSPRRRGTVSPARSSSISTRREPSRSSTASSDQLPELVFESRVSPHASKSSSIHETIDEQEEESSPDNITSNTFSAHDTPHATSADRSSPHSPRTSFERCHNALDFLHLSHSLCPVVRSASRSSSSSSSSIISPASPTESPTESLHSTFIPASSKTKKPKLRLCPMSRETSPGTEADSFKEGKVKSPLFRRSSSRKSAKGAKKGEDDLPELREKTGLFRRKGRRTISEPEQPALLLASPTSTSSSFSETPTSPRTSLSPVFVSPASRIKPKTRRAASEQVATTHQVDRHGRSVDLTGNSKLTLHGHFGL